MAVELVDAAEEAFDEEPEAVEMAFEASTAVDDACAPSPGASAVAVESFAPELAAAPVGLPVVEVALLRPDALAAAGPPDDVVDAVAGGSGSSSNPPPLALAVLGLPSFCVPAAPAPAPPNCSESLLELAPAPAPAPGET
ncbi:hypothetical protein [Actinomycetospora sp. NBRC 106378]|uniref:hypothetical protein n=1 Tax=Actinomycetospora sp. NBRC 106378 TaxID=3032208 RepID=UPI002555DE3D|nr:hypothetical protein [Actinomycetospora sp. NBRC 106378]